MKFIHQLTITGDPAQAIELYKRAFGCTVKSLLFYSDAVAHGWEQPDESKSASLYHCELMFGDTEVRILVAPDAQASAFAGKIVNSVGLDTEDEVRSAFGILSEGGEVVSPLEKPPYVVVIGSVRDRFGVLWRLMCDY